MVTSRTTGRFLGPLELTIATTLTLSTTRRHILVIAQPMKFVVELNDLSYDG